MLAMAWGAIFASRVTNVFDVYFGNVTIENMSDNLNQFYTS
jgi:hypothetical protein